MKSIAAVTFDLWHTLVRELPGSTEKVSELRIAGISEVLESAGSKYTVEEVEAAYHKTSTFLEQTWRAARDLPARNHVIFLLDQIEEGLPDLLVPEDMDTIERIYSEAMLEHPPALVDGARRVLTELRQSGYALGLISNTGKTPGTTLRTVLDRMGVLSFFRATTFSDEIAVRKPEEAIFLTTLEGLGTRPAAAVHVGDDPNKDIDGARACGMRAIQVAWPEMPISPRANLFVNSLVELPGAILDLDEGLSEGQEVRSA